jgi:hypothetical protein
MSARGGAVAVVAGQNVWRVEPATSLAAISQESPSFSEARSPAKGIAQVGSSEASLRTKDDEKLRDLSSFVPFQLLADTIILHVCLNNRGPFAMMLDSGAVNFITPGLVRELQLEVGDGGLAMGVGRRLIESGQVYMNSVQIGNIVLHEQRFHVVPLPYGAVHAFPEALVGGIGYEVLRQLAVSVDFDHEQIRLYDGRTFRYTGNGSAVPFVILERLPVIQARLDGIAGTFEVDTGAENALSVNYPFVREHHLATKYDAHVEGFAGEGIGGRENAYFVRIAEFEIAGVPVSSVVASLSQNGGGISGDPYMAGLIGVGILRRFNITFDYAHSVIYFEKNSNFGQPGVFNRAGFAPRITPEGVVVASVFQGSPAADCGIRPDDLILDIDGRTGRALNGPYLFSMLRRAPGTVLRLEILHRGWKRRVHLTLRDFL